ncbi:MAG: SAM-dependent methyltransferase, partial [Bacteroidota bacterium]
QGNFFDLSDQFDLIVEQTFFCSLHPDNRGNYARKVSELLTENGRLVGVLFNDALFSDHPPFGGFNENYTPHFAPFFDFKVFELCYNSIKPRAGRELFINLVKK